MLIYKFKIRFEEYEDFLREIELRADQTFEDFHQAILGNLGLDPGMLASFFICDHRYRKLQEIQLVDMDPSSPPGQASDEVEAETDKGEDDSLREDKEERQVGALLMHETFLKDHIDDPHQRMLFMYDNLNQWTFYIELMKIQRASDAQSYPRISKSKGAVPRELLATPKQIPGVETPMDFSYGDGDAPPEDLSDFDQIEGGEDYYDDTDHDEPPKT